MLNFFKQATNKWPIFSDITDIDILSGNQNFHWPQNYEFILPY